MSESESIAGSIRSLKPLPPPVNGFSEYIGKPPPIPEDAEAIPNVNDLIAHYTQEANDRRAAHEEMEMEEDAPEDFDHEPEFTYPDLPPPGYDHYAHGQGMMYHDQGGDRFQGYSSHDSNSHTPMHFPIIDPQLQHGMRNYGNGAGLALGELQQMAESSNHPFRRHHSPNSYQHQHYHHASTSQQDGHVYDDTRDAEGEIDNGWSSNIVYGAYDPMGSMGESSHLTGDSHIMALRNALSASGVTPVFSESTT